MPRFHDVMVDTGQRVQLDPESDPRNSSWAVSPVRIDRFETADGRVLEREIGFALLYAGGRSAPAVRSFSQATPT